MIVNSHNPESCPIRGPQEQELMAEAIYQFRDQAVSNGMTVHDWWASRGSHEIFIDPYAVLVVNEVPFELFAPRFLV